MPELAARLTLAMTLPAREQMAPVEAQQAQQAQQAQEAQQAQLVALMKASDPDRPQIPGVLWSRQALKALIERRFGVSLSRQTVGVNPRRWGFSGEKPQRRWLEQDPERVRAALEQEFPAIGARARRGRAVVLFGDEMGVPAGQTAGRSHAPAGERTVVPLAGKRSGANAISAIGADGTILLDILEGTCDEVCFIGFLDKPLEHFPERKNFLIADNASFHRPPAIERWLADHPRMELFHLAPCGPELSPDELLNQDVHTHVARHRLSTLVQLVALAATYLTARTGEVVSDYFNGRHVANASSPCTICHPV